MESERRALSLSSTASEFPKTPGACQAFSQDFFETWEAGRARRIRRFTWNAPAARSSLRLAHLWLRHRRRQGYNLSASGVEGLARSTSATADPIS
jgi:hypothetical protein